MFPKCLHGADQFKVANVYNLCRKVNPNRNDKQLII